MRVIIGKVLASTLFYLNDLVRAIIRLARLKWIYPLYKKLSQASQTLRNGTQRNWQRHALNEDEGLGAAYDKGKWMRAYYEKTDRSMTGRSEKSSNNA